MGTRQLFREEDDEKRRQDSAQEDVVWVHEEDKQDSAPDSSVIKVRQKSGERIIERLVPESSVMMVQNESGEWVVERGDKAAQGDVVSVHEYELEPVVEQAADVRARRIEARESVSRLLGRELERAVARYSQLERNLCDFVEQTSVLRDHGYEEQVCLEMPNGVPLPIKLGLHPGSVMNPVSNRLEQGLFTQIYEQTLKSLLGSFTSKIDLQYTAHEKAVSGFLTRLRGFIETRLPPSLPPPPRSKKGYEFRVETASSGLRVHVSDAYYFDPHQLFAWPTTPVKGFLDPGIYIFGAAARFGEQVVFDETVEYRIPDHTGARLEI